MQLEPGRLEAGYRELDASELDGLDARALSGLIPIITFKEAMKFIKSDYIQHNLECASCIASLALAKAEASSWQNPY